MARPRIAKPLKTHLMSVRVTEDEWVVVNEQSHRAGLVPSEYVRRRVLGHRIVARIHDHTVNELRRLGGLQKHLSSNVPEYRQEFEKVLEEIREAIMRIDNTVAGAEEI